MRNILKLLSLLIVAFALVSCGDLFEFEGETSDLNKITLDRHTLYMMAGDTYQFSVSFEPDTLRNKSVYWMSNNVSVASVVVSYGWYMPENYYPFDMVVNADITVNGQPLKEGMQVAAFVGTQIRGIGVQRKFFDVTYTELRIYSPLKPYGPNENQHPLETNAEPIDPEEVVFRVYDRDSQTMYVSSETITFDGLTHGYPSNLYPLNFK